jgi:hypothetical protein
MIFLFHFNSFSFLSLDGFICCSLVSESFSDEDSPNNPHKRECLIKREQRKKERNEKQKKRMRSERMRL